MVTFGKIFEAWKAEKMLYVKESSMATYLLLAEKHLLPVFKDATEIKERDAQAFVIQKLQNGLSQKTTKDCIIVLRMILRYADKNDWWICRPWDLRYPPVKNVKKLSVMSQKEQKTLMNYLAMNYSLRNLGILICLNTGMRTPVGRHQPQRALHHHLALRLSRLLPQQQRATPYVPLHRDAQDGVVEPHHPHQRRAD